MTKIIPLRDSQRILKAVLPSVELSKHTFKPPVAKELPLNSGANILKAVEVTVGGILMQAVGRPVLWLLKLGSEINGDKKAAKSYQEALNGVDTAFRRYYADKGFPKSGEMLTQPLKLLPDKTAADLITRIGTKVARLTKGIKSIGSALYTSHK